MLNKNDFKELISQTDIKLSQFAPSEENLKLIRQSVSELQSLYSQAKNKKKEKQLCSKNFKLVKDQPDELIALKEQMQCISSDIKYIENEIKQTEHSISQLLETDCAEKEENIEQYPKHLTKTDLASAEKETASDESSTCELTEEIKQYIRNHPNSNLYHDPRWNQVFKESFQHSTHYICAKNSKNDITGVLPITELNSKLFGSFGVSLPFVNYGGPLTDNTNITETLLVEAEKLAKIKNWSHLELRTCDDSLSWPSTSKKVSMILKLPQDKEDLNQQLGSKLRAQVKRCEQYNPTLNVGNIELLNEFYRVFATNMRDLGTPVYSKAFFSNILEAFPKESNIILVKINDITVSAAFVIGHSDTLEIPWASTLRHANKYNANMWMYKQILEHAITSGYQFFDFGRSTEDAGTYKFKKQWGSRPIKHHWYYWLPDGEKLPELNPDNKKFKLLIAAWKRMPIWLTKIVGPLIVRGIP